MSENISLEEIKKNWPSSAPDISNITKYVEWYLCLFTSNLKKSIEKNDCSLSGILN